MKYCTLLCDIKDSRKLQDRDILQYKIIDMLTEANTIFKDIIASPFLITLGDEWEGLLRYPCNYFKVLDFFKTSIPNVKFYAGVGIGEIIIHDFNLTVNQLDGPSFYRSREAVSYAKKKNLPLVVLFDDWDNF
jgi:hypothetical protein